MKKKREKISFIAILKMYPIAILALIDTIMVLIPTYFENYIPNVYGNLNMSASQYSEGLALYGIFSIVMNFIGAYLGGKFSGRKLILISLIIQIAIAIWYASLMFQYTVPPDNANYGKHILPQWIGILFLYSVAISGLIWGPLWRIIKNYGTEELKGKDKEKKVGFNNGLAGTFEGIFGLIIGIIGAILMGLASANEIPNIHIFGTTVTASFLVLVSLTILLTITASLLTYFYIKPIENQGNNGFVLRNIYTIIKNWKVWCLGMVVIGIFMLQMELSAYISYLQNIFLIAPLIVTIFGLVRTYVMRFLLAGYVGKKADKFHSYIFILVVGLFLGIIFIAVAILLPGIGGGDTLAGTESWKLTILQILAILNLVILGGITWTLVTLRWSPIGTELGITNENYASAVAFLSAMGFSPGLYFKFIKSAIENKYATIKIPSSSNPAGYIMVVNKTGNQLILLTCACIAFAGFIAGLILYIYLYRKSNKYAFRRFIIKRKEKNINT